MEQTPGEGARAGLHLALLEFLTVLPEEVQKADIPPTRKAKITQELCDSTQSILDFIQSILQVPIPADASQSMGILATKQRALRCAQSWIQYGVPLGSLGPLMAQVVALLAMPETFEGAIDVLIELISDPSMRAYEETLSNGLLSVVTTGWMRDEFARAINEQDEQVARPICRLLVQMGETFTTFLVANFLRDDVRTYMEMLLACTAFDGYFPADQELSYPFIINPASSTIWDLLAETIITHLAELLPGDDSVLANLPASVIAGGVSVRSPLGKVGGPAALERHKQVSDSAKALYARLVEVLRKKLTYPPDAEWNGWASDVKDRFRVYRRDCADTFPPCYDILSDIALGSLTQSAMTQLQDFVDGRCRDWQPLEATIFSIKALAERVSDAESVYLPHIFGDAFLGRLAVLSNPELTRPKRASLYAIGEYAAWLNQNPQYINPSATFLIDSLRQPELASAAVVGLEELSHECRTQLVEGVDLLVSVWVEAGTELQPPEKSRLVRAVAQVVQVLPRAALLPRLLRVLNGIVADIQKALASLNQDPELARQTVLDQLGYLKACCQGIQPTQDLEGSLETIATIPASGSTDAEEQQVAVVMWEVTQGICNAWSTDEEVMEALCKFIEKTFRTDLHIFAPNLFSLNNLLVTLYNSSPFACILDAAAMTIVAYGDREGAISPEQKGELARLVSGVADVSVVWIGTKAGMEGRPDVVHSFFQLLTQCLHRCLWAIVNLNQAVLDTIFQMVLAGLQVQEWLALKSILHFLENFVDMDYETSEIAQMVKNVVGVAGPVIIQQILQGIAGQMPKSMDSELARLLHKLVVKYPDPTREWLEACLQQEGFPSARLTALDKTNFVFSIMTKRFVRIKEAVKTFGNKCRGLEGTAFANAV
ncbi:hypothetical protein HK104_004636 [Borealophlyctis nickersoniae]|nr:hypothetical protein HK104_004636 [Borealophlyctis nickersoniae]